VQVRHPRGPVFDFYGGCRGTPTTRELEKIETQHDDNETTIKRHGGTVGAQLDDGLSAWKLGVRRPGFEKLLERASIPGAGPHDGWPSRIWVSAPRSGVDARPGRVEVREQVRRQLEPGAAQLLRVRLERYALCRIDERPAPPSQT
jgi:hypothetical protein